MPVITMDVIYPFLSPFLLLIVIYLFAVRPRRQQAAKHAAMIASLRTGDLVTTSGGVQGRVTGWKGETIVVEVAPGVVFDVAPAKIESVSEQGVPPRQARGSRPAGCPECGAPAGPGDQFCGDCGAPLT